MSKSENPNLIRTFTPSKPSYSPITLHHVHVYIQGACLRYLMEGHQLSLTRGFGEVMKTVEEYTDATYDKVVAYLYGHVKLNAGFSDHQITVAEYAKQLFYPEGSPLTPGNRAQNTTVPDSDFHTMIRVAFESLVKDLPNNRPSDDDGYARARVEFDMGMMQGPHAHKHPGFRTSIIQPGRLTYTHHFLIQDFTTKQDLQDYAEMMTGGDTTCIHVFGLEDVASHQTLVDMYIPTVMAKWRDIYAKSLKK